MSKRQKEPEQAHSAAAATPAEAKETHAELQEGLARLARDTAPPVGARFGARLRTYFLTGLVVVGPVTITIYIAWYFINVVDAWVKPYIPTIYNPSHYVGIELPGVGLIFAFIGLTMIGALAANLIGRSLISAGESMLGSMPIVRNVYSGLKQIFESVVTATGTNKEFQKVGLMEFPSKGIWSIVFVTGEVSGRLAEVAPDKELISVFLPTGMLPPTGFVCFVPRNNVINTTMSVEDAAKIIISAGMVNPETQAKFGQIAENSRNGGGQKG